MPNVDTLVAPELWERRPGETPKAYAMFIAYRDQGAFHHSLRELARNEPATNLRQLAVWSKEHDWPARAAAWDDHLQRLSDISQLEAADAMRRRHQALGFTLINAAIERARTIDIEKLTVRETLMIADLAIRIERHAHADAPTSIESPMFLEPDGPTGADILIALRTHPELLDLADKLDEVMLAGSAE